MCVGGVAFSWTTTTTTTTPTTRSSRLRTMRTTTTSSLLLLLLPSSVTQDFDTHRQLDERYYYNSGNIGNGRHIPATVKQQQQQQPSLSTTTTTSAAAAAAAAQQLPRRITLTRYLDQQVAEHPELADLESLLLGLQMACKTISNLVNRAGLVYSSSTNTAPATTATTTAKGTTTTDNNINKNYNAANDDDGDGRFYSMKRLDQLSTLVLKNALKYTGKCEVVTPLVSQPDSESPAQHQPGVLIAKSLDSPYVACLDPLDGSGNADASICTGTIFGVFHDNTHNNNEVVIAADQHDNKSANYAISPEQQRTEELVKAVLQPAKNMRAAGYCLYSSATVLVFTLGDTVQGFTLDPQLNEFVLTHPNLTIPARGTVYSCNEANSEGWDDNYRAYLRAIKTGQGRSQQRYAHRYVGSMVGDLHRTLLYGGLFAYPADTATHPDGNLQLLYKTAPMAAILHRAGGKGVDGRGNSLLDIRPARVHQKSPCFLGSPDDVEELESYLNGKQQKS